MSRLNGVQLKLDRSNPFVAAVFGYIEGADTIDNAITLFNAAEALHGIQILPFGHGAENEKERPPDAQWCETSLYPFLTSTQFVITGGDLLSVADIYDAQGFAVSFSWRQWGEIVSTWANGHWYQRPAGLGEVAFAREARPWCYTDFYLSSYLDYVIADYSQWIAALHKIVESKLH